MGEKNINIEDMATFCKKKGFVFPNSDIYNGLAGFFDYGPYGVELKNNIKASWWKRIVRDRQDVVGIDGSVISNPKVWEASGHVSGFSDLLLTCTKCKEKIRADHFIEGSLSISADGFDAAKINSLVKENNLVCPQCKGPFAPTNDFNLMFSTNVGPVLANENKAYLRPETAQQMFTNFKIITETCRVKLPFGIAQIGRSFRNEISPRDFLFRVREFEQMEMEFFIHPEKNECNLLTEDVLNFKIVVNTSADQKNGSEPKEMSFGDLVNGNLISEWHAYWIYEHVAWFLDLGIALNNLRLREHLDTELAHYSSACFDIEYRFPFGFKEVVGIADRGCFDLTQHQNHSKKTLEIFDEETKAKVLPNVVEPASGLDRIFLVLMFEAYNDDKERGNVVLHFNPRIAPQKVGIFPLLKKDGLPDIAVKLFDDLRDDFESFYDASGSIGRRYARADEIGIPYALTIDHQTKDDGTITIRDRVSRNQARIPLVDASNIITNLIKGKKKFEEL